MAGHESSGTPRRHSVLIWLAVFLGSFLLFLSLGIGMGWVQMDRILSRVQQSPAAQAPREIAWQQLQTLDVQTGEAPPELQALAGQRVQLAGYIVVMDGVQDRLTEFLLVPVAGMCIHIPPPPPNLMVHIQSPEGIQAKEWMGKGVLLRGILRIESVDSEYGVAGFRFDQPELAPLAEDRLLNTPEYEPVDPDPYEEPIL